MLLRTLVTRSGIAARSILGARIYFRRRRPTRTAEGVARIFGLLTITSDCFSEVHPRAIPFHSTTQTLQSPDKSCMVFPTTARRVLRRFKGSLSCSLTWRTGSGVCISCPYGSGHHVYHTGNKANPVCPWPPFQCCLCRMHRLSALPRSHPHDGLTVHQAFSLSLRER